jgi:hypothetical protein
VSESSITQQMNGNGVLVLQLLVIRCDCVNGDHNLLDAGLAVKVAQAMFSVTKRRF